MKRDYVEEITDILEKYNGCVTGFNKLRKLGNFHRTALTEYLKGMEDKNLIEVTKINKQVKRYCLPSFDFKK